MYVEIIKYLMFIKKKRKIFEVFISFWNRFFYVIAGAQIGCQ